METTIEKKGVLYQVQLSQESDGAFTEGFAKTLVEMNAVKGIRAITEDAPKLNKNDKEEPKRVWLYIAQHQTMEQVITVGDPEDPKLVKELQGEIERLKKELVKAGKSTDDAKKVLKGANDKAEKGVGTARDQMKVQLDKALKENSDLMTKNNKTETALAKANQEIQVLKNKPKKTTGKK